VSDYTGHTVSGSAIVRALVRYAGQQRYDWGLAYLSPLIEQEITAGGLGEKCGKVFTESVGFLLCRHHLQLA
jgi:hypothetical protein